MKSSAKKFAFLFHRKDTCILLDVGEGTIGQIYRFYGAETDNIVKKIKAIYISHLHADHHIGKNIVVEEMINQ